MTADKFSPDHELARFASTLTHDAIPQAVRERAKLLIADAVGIAIRAGRDSVSASIHARALLSMGQQGPCPVFGITDRFSLLAATELNGALIHSLDFDDTFAAGALHPTAPVLPAALAAARLTGASGADVLTAVVSAYEGICRISVALGPADHYDRGFHPTATCGVFGAALAASRVLGLDPEQTCSAMGIALSQSAGSLQFLVDGAWTKPFQVGAAARAGWVSACLAREGYRGPVDALGGKHGFLAAYAPNGEAAKLASGLGQEWRTMEIAVKPYPSCRFAHAAVDGVIALRNEYQLVPEQVSRIVCGLSRKALLLVGDPIEEKRRANSVVAAQFSMPFNAAVALIDGRIGWESYTRHLGSGETMKLMGCVDVEHDIEVEALFPTRFGARVRIELNDGRWLERLVRSPSGESESFVSTGDMECKFSDLVDPCLGERGRKVLFASLLDLDGAARIDTLFDGSI
jgi:2-methylcitrate dehydratase PrpD